MLKKIISLTIICILCLSCFSFAIAETPDKINLPSGEERRTLIEGLLNGTIEVQNEDPDNPVCKSLLKNSSIQPFLEVENQEIILYDRNIITDVRRIEGATQDPNETAYISTIIYEDTYLIKDKDDEESFIVKSGDEEYRFVGVLMAFDVTFTKIRAKFGNSYEYAYKVMDGYGGWVETDDPQMMCSKIFLEYRGYGNCTTSTTATPSVKSDSANRTVNSPQKESLYFLNAPRTYYYFNDVDQVTGVGLRMDFILKRTVSSYTYKDHIDDWRGRDLWDTI